MKNRTIIITGSNGMIGSFFIDIIMDKNARENLQCWVIVVECIGLETKLFIRRRYKEYHSNYAERELLKAK